MLPNPKKYYKFVLHCFLSSPLYRTDCSPKLSYSNFVSVSIACSQLSFCACARAWARDWEVSLIHTRAFPFQPEIRRHPINLSLGNHFHLLITIIWMEHWRYHLTRCVSSYAPLIICRKGGPIRNIQATMGRMCLPSPTNQSYLLFRTTLLASNLILGVQWAARAARRWCR